MTHPCVSPHARVRAIERLGFEPSADEWRDAVILITNGVLGSLPAARLVHPLQRKANYDHPSEVWQVPIRNRLVRVVWAPELARVLTVLQPNTLDWHPESRPR